MTDTPKTEIEKDIIIAAEWIAAALESSNYCADFTTESFKDVDRFFDEHARNGRPVAGGLLSEDLGQRIFAIGSYVGETIKRQHGGEWIGDDKDPEAEINVSLRLPDGSAIWPTQRAMKRMRNGKEDSIYAYGRLIEEELKGK